jgi:putative sigma-54 modulation protein
MRLQVKGKNVDVTPSIREYAERKLSKLSKQLAEQTQVEVELSEQRNPSIAASHVAEATIFTKGPTLRAREASPDMRASIDQLVEKLERQVKRYREMRTVEPRRHAEHNGDTSSGAAA